MIGYALNIVFLVVVIISGPPVVRSLAAPEDVLLRPFTVKKELAPGRSGVRVPRGPRAMTPRTLAGGDGGLFRDDLDAGRDDIPRTDPHAPGEEQGRRAFRLTFSRSFEEQRGRDVLRPGGEKDDLLARIGSLPTLLDNPSAHGAFRAIGEVFKPRLNLEIEF